MAHRRPTLYFEKLFWSAGCRYIAGVDEAGVAPLAGPVVAAAVILKPRSTLRELPKVNDSKLLSPKDRQRLYDVIVRKCVDYGVGVSSVSEIDSINIFQATRQAMRRALEQLKAVNIALLDGPHLIPDYKIVQWAIIDGDAKIASISAASIIAKVTRDLLMADLHEQYPEYGFAKHKGYPTKFHIAKIRELGPTPVHRTSFLKKIL